MEYKKHAAVVLKVLALIIIGLAIFGGCRLLFGEGSALPDYIGAVLV